MTTLGNLAVLAGRANGKAATKPLDIPSLVASISADPALSGLWQGLAASLEAWTNQDDDAHEPCSLTACRAPLHPGPCKGWKHTLHATSPHIWRAMEDERVRKANDRRLKRIADLRSQNKPIPRRLLTEIKPKAAPSGPHPGGSSHPAMHVSATPLGQVGQKADLTGGQAHAASQAINKAAGIVPNTPKLPLGPKGKKPSVAGRGLAFVITQPKVTDQYKIDKAAKITPAEWDALTPGDRKAIRDELEAIKVRGFGPQQKKADELLGKLLPASTLGTQTPATNIAQAAQALAQTKSAGQAKAAQAVAQSLANPKISTLHAPGKVSLGQAVKAPKKADPDILANLTPAQRKTYETIKSKGSIPGGYTHPGVYQNSLGKLEKLGLIKYTKISDHESKIEAVPVDEAVKSATKLSGIAAPGGGLKPAAPNLPGTAAHIQYARAVANRTAPKAQVAKTHLDAYGALTKDEFDKLPDGEKKQIRDDLANAKAKFLDPKKQQAAADLLGRFGSSTAPAAPTVGTAKGYSDPMNEAVKHATSGTASTDDVLSSVARLNPGQVGKLDDADKKAVVARLGFIASHPKATQAQKDRAAAYARIIDKGSAAQTSRKWDHTPSIGELHREEESSGTAKVAAALAAAGSASMDRDARIAAMAALTKPQFDALKPEDQRTITNALQELHARQRDDATEKAVTLYTGDHPAINRLKTAEADFRAGKATSDHVHSALLTARVQAPATKDVAVRKAVDAEAARIAKDNPTLETYARVRLAGEQQYGNTTYNAIGLAGMKHNWQAAPRLSQNDLDDLFKPTDADLAKADPIHAQAVRDLQNHVLETGLRGQPGVPSGSPWSTATRNAAVDAALGTDRHGEIPAERLGLYKSLSPGARENIRRTLNERLASQTDLHAKTATWLTLRDLHNAQPLDAKTRAAVLLATDRYATTGKLDAYRHLDPADFRRLPGFAQDAIKEDLNTLHGRAVSVSNGTASFSPSDNAFKVFPKALADHLTGDRVQNPNREARNAVDVARYGGGYISPASRVQVYSRLSAGAMQSVDPADHAKIEKDLGDISGDTSLPMLTRYDAQFAKDLRLGTNSSLSGARLSAVEHADPHPNGLYGDNDVVQAFGKLDKADYDSLDPTYRDAIDARIKGLPGPDQQLLNAKFHPVTAANNPSGLAATNPATVAPHVQAALDTIYGVHPKSHTMAHQLSTYGALRGHDFGALNPQEQQHALADLSYIHTTAKGPSAAKAKLLIDRFTPAGTPSGHIPTPAVIPPANAVPGQVRYATPLVGLEKAANTGVSGDGWISTPTGGRVWGKYGAAGLLIKHVDPNSGEERYLMVQRGPAISDPGKWTFPGGAIDSKETPHQGAARETIEELGLKDDQLKNAVVHGDHTFTIPGSSWKYTTVAAQVDKQFQPNLSTAHARAETSDAKWMTLSEIQALDKKGALHHPIAGGKLEQNVISLYPQGQQGTKLGQIARPGPITKRQNRLAMPVGGRKAPDAYNAWPHAHKQSKGKDLIGDKTAMDAMRQKVKQERVLYDGKTADGRLAAIGAMQGFDDTPTVMDKKDIDRLLATGDYIEAWRGVNGAGGWSMRGANRSNGKTAAQINEEMRTGPAYYGKGIFGNGYYLATDKRVADQYADGSPGSIVRMLIPKSAVTKKYDEIANESTKLPRASKAKGAGYGEISTFYDPGRYAAAKGIDGLEINPHHRAHAGGSAGHVAKHGKPAFNWLNRSVLIVQKEPG